MTNEEFKQFMDEFTAKEEQKLGVGSLEFKKRHEEIMSGCDLLHDLMLERAEGM